MYVRVEALSSDGETRYVVVFRIKDGVMKGTCGCRAGIFGKACKHKTAVLAGDASILADPSDAPKLAEVGKIVEAAGLTQRMADMTEAQKVAEEATRIFKKIKASVWKELHNGIPVPDGASS